MSMNKLLVVVLVVALAICLSIVFPVDASMLDGKPPVEPIEEPDCN